MMLPTVAVLVTLLTVSAAGAQGFTLNPFAKQEPADPAASRRAVSDAPPPSRSPFSLPKMSLPAPQLPKLSMPAMPKLSLPGMGGSNGQAPPRGPAKPSALSRFNSGAKSFLVKTRDFVTAPFSSKPKKQQTRARMTSAEKSKGSSSLFKLPTWLGGSPEPPPQPRSVGEFLAQPRPGFDR